MKRLHYALVCCVCLTTSVVYLKASSGYRAGYISVDDRNLDYMIEHARDLQDRDSLLKERQWRSWVPAWIEGRK